MNTPSRWPGGLLRTATLEDASSRLAAEPFVLDSTALSAPLLGVESAADVVVWSPTGSLVGSLLPGRQLLDLEAIFGEAQHGLGWRSTF